MPKINKVTWNNISSDSLGIFVTGSGSFNAAELDVTKYKIPGRNGDLIIPGNRYKNIEVTYPVFIPGDFLARAQSIRNWMRSATTYKTLTDTYDPDHYRLAIPVGIQEFTPVWQNTGANFQLIFDCKPQRFLNTTEQTMSNGTLTNSTLFDAYPLIVVTNPTSSASITVTNTKGTFTLSATQAYTGTVTIDCETMNIYSGSTNLNHLFSGSFPVLAPGSNTVSRSGVTSPKITTRYWEL